MSEPIEGEVVVPDDEANEAHAALERVEREGLLPAPTPHSRMVTYREAVELGHVLAASGYFKDATTAAQAAVKVMVGSELGFSPMASIMGVHVIEGRPSVGGRLLGAIVKQSGEYDYELDGPHVTRDEDGKPVDGYCKVTILRNGHPLDPVSEFTWTEAVVAGLVKPSSNWIKWPAKMLYWRALSWAIDYHCPHLVGGMPLLATEDAEAEVANGDAEQSTGIADAMVPPKDKPAPLTDDKAETLRKRAQAAYDRLRAVNPTLVPPARFANQISAAEHSHTRLEQVAQAFEDVADTEETIAKSTARLVELKGEADAGHVIDEALKRSTRAEVRDHLLGALELMEGAEPGEDGEDEEGKG